MTIQDAAKSALAVQDACNLSGVVFEFARCMQAVCDHCRDLGTTGRNRHPIVTMFLLKLAELNGCGSTLHESYEAAEAECKQIAGEVVCAERS